MEPSQNHDLLIRIDERVKLLIEKVNDISQNHLPHLNARLDKIEQRIAYYVGGIGGIMVIADILLRFVVK